MKSNNLIFSGIFAILLISICLSSVEFPDKPVYDKNFQNSKQEKEKQSFEFKEEILNNDAIKRNNLSKDREPWFKQVPLNEYHRYREKNKSNTKLPSKKNEIHVDEMEPVNKFTIVNSRHVEPVISHGLSDPIVIENTNKRARSLLGLARSYLAANLTDKARKILMSIIEDYPNTVSARLSKKELDNFPDCRIKI